MTAPLSLAELTACGAHQRGHFLLSSGLHSGDYLQCALYLAQPRRAAKAGELLAELVRAAGLAPELVVAPAMGGLIIGHETARALDLTLRRGFALAPRQRVLVVEDVVTTGRSTREVFAIVAQAGAEVIGVGSLVNRSGLDTPFAPLPSRHLLAAAFPTWPAGECPLCRDAVPIAKPGSRPIV